MRTTGLRADSVCATVPNWNGNKQLFSVSATAGRDSSGRVVHLGLPFILEPLERPRFELTYAGLSEEDKAYASALLHRMTSSGRGDSWAQSVCVLIGVPSDSRPATNVALDHSVVRFRSLYVVGPGGLTKKAVNRSKWRTTAIILLTLFTVVVVWVFVHAKNWPFSLRHQQFSRPTVQIGVVTWRFN